MNQNQTHRDEIRGGFLWSPKRNSDGARNQFYENMTLVEPGDVVFSYFGTRLQQVGTVLGRAVAEQKPEFTAGGDGWSNDGWYVPVEFTPVRNPIRPKDHIDALLPHLPSKYSPLRTNGDGLQGVYLAELPDAMAAVILQLTGAVPLDIGPNETSIVRDLERVMEEEPATEAVRLVKARLGQGVFRSQVRLREDRCRITGVDTVHHLRASHIKPWSVSSSKEKIDGANGLLLAPHIDHLFDRGWVSFEDNGRLLVADQLDERILEAWSVRQEWKRPFDPEQAAYLRYHRENVLQR